MRKENAGKLGALEIKAMCKIMQILCLTERKKITKICKYCGAVSDVLIFQTT